MSVEVKLWIRMTGGTDFHGDEQIDWCWQNLRDDDWGYSLWNAIPAGEEGDVPTYWTFESFKAATRFVRRWGGRGSVQ